MKNIVLVGAGGTGMSGIAGILADLGFKNIVCIDSTQSQLTDNLEKKGMKVIIGHGKYTPSIDDAIIYSEAVANSPEVLSARNLISEHKKMMIIMNYFQFLGEMSKYFTTIGITGTNGKSSTTALTIYGAKDLPIFGLGILGALVPDFNNQSYLINHTHQEEIKNIFTRIFTGKYPPSLKERGMGGEEKSLLFIVEACEYKRHFLHLDLDYTAITSLEFDHADYYKDFEEYKNAFKQLLTKLKQKAFVLNGFLRNNPEFNEFSHKITEISEEQYRYKYIFGPHVNKNASLANTILDNISPLGRRGARGEDTRDFKGLWRRLEYLGTTPNRSDLFSDYGHMASSIHIGYQALKNKFPEKKLVAVFQPHQITRIFTGRDDFVQSFTGYDEVIIYDIYAARESLQDFDFSRRGEHIHNITELGNTFAKACGGIYIEKRETFKEYSRKRGPDTSICVFSAGDIDYKLRNEFDILA